MALFLCTTYVTAVFQAHKQSKIAS